MKIHLLALGFLALLVCFETEAKAADETSPTIAQVEPAAGTVSSLTQITVHFSEPIAGISRFDLLVNGQTANSLEGDNEIWVFRFDQPAHGTVLINWDLNHTISDVEGNRFNESG